MGLQDQKPHLMLCQGFIGESKLKNSLKWRFHNQSRFRLFAFTCIYVCLHCIDICMILHVCDVNDVTLEVGQDSHSHLQAYEFELATVLGQGAFCRTTVAPMVLSQIQTIYTIFEHSR